MNELFSATQDSNDIEDSQLFEYLTPSQRFETITDVMAILAVRLSRKDDERDEFQEVGH